MATTTSSATMPPTPPPAHATAAAAMDVDMDVVERSKSESDLKKYKLLTLPNGLEVLLISTKDVPRRADDDSDDNSDDSNDEDASGDDDSGSDSDEDMSDDDDDAFDDDDAHDSDRSPPSRRAGACLTVGVGSYAEPVDLPGLAHYLEHMVFMGSAKYPDENAFEAFLSAHGGYSNGSTDNEVTRYTFEVGPAFLQQALDMFAQFFIAPLMTSSTLERELSAIESEFSQATQNDRIRQQQVLCAAAPASHPYSRFGWGNRLSLKELPEANGIDVHAAIRTFYDAFYSANIMKLVVCGDDALEVMEQWVTASFREIPNKHIDSPSFGVCGAPFGTSVSPLAPVVCRIVPVRDMHVLQLDWMLPSIFGTHQQKPADYIASLLGHESAGSVLSLLKAKGWISALTAGVTDTDGNDAGTFGAKFDVTIKLTLEGLKEWDAIVKTVFEYLYMIQQSGFPQWVFDELQALAAISFRFQQEQSAVESCEELAEIMQAMYQVPRPELLRYELLDGAFNKAMVADVLTHLTPANVIVTILSRSVNDDPAFATNALTEPWFNITYTKELVAEEVVASWQSVALNPQLALPKPNPFIPRDFALIATNEASSTGDVTCYRSLFGRLWHKVDRQFQTPRAHVALLFHLPTIVQSVDSIVATELFVQLVNDALNEFAYHASVAELSYSLRVKESALELIVGGFNDKLAALVDVVVAALFATRVDPLRFVVLQQDLLRSYRNSIATVSHKAKYLRLQLLERNAFSLQQSLVALEALDVVALERFVGSTLWSAGTHVSSFAHGNISVDAAIALQTTVEDALQHCPTHPLAATAIPKRFIHELPSTQCGLLVEAASEHVDETNTQVEFYYQIGPHTLGILAIVDLLEQLMEEPLFDSLRTKQELGYDVSCSVRVTHGIIGFGVLVQSSLVDAHSIAFAIDRFVVEFQQALATMSDKHFCDHVQAQILKKREPDHNLMETTHRYWDEITTGRLAFELEEELAKELESVTKRDVVKCYKKWFIDAPRKLVVHVVGQAATPGRSPHSKKDIARMKALAPKRIADLYAFKADLSVYDDNTRVAFEADAADADAVAQGDSSSMKL